MRMTAVPEREMRRFLEAHGASVLRAEARDGGAVHTVRYSVTPCNG